MRGITALATLGIAITLPALPLLHALLRGQSPSDQLAAPVINAVMLVLCGMLLIVCISAFAWATYKQVWR